MPTPGSHTVAFAICGPIRRADLPGLCERVCALLSESRAEIALCDVTGVDSDAVTVDALARLQLAAGRHGCQVRLCNASEKLLELVDFMGLRDVLRTDAQPMSSRTGSGLTEQPPSTRRTPWEATHPGRSS